MYILVSHLLCDGIGLKELIYALCQIYNGNRVEDKSFMNRDFLNLLDFNNKKISTFKLIKSAVGNYKNKALYNNSIKWMECIYLKKLFQMML